MDLTTKIDGNFPDYFWVVREEKPVRELVRSCGTFRTRTATWKDFQETCKLLGWDNDAMEVRL